MRLSLLDSPCPSIICLQVPVPNSRTGRPRPPLSGTQTTLDLGMLQSPPSVLSQTCPDVDVSSRPLDPRRSLRRSRIRLWTAASSRTPRRRWYGRGARCAIGRPRRGSMYRYKCEQCVPPAKCRSRKRERVQSAAEEAASAALYLVVRNTILELSAA